jgi:pilus assembly protein CpaB
VTATRRRRRALVLLSLALACGGLAASHVQSRERQVEAAIGPLVPVLVTRTDVDAGARLKPRELAVRRVPARFAPRDALSGPDGVAGQRPAVALPAGSYVTAGALDSGGGREAGGGAPIRRGERSTDVAVTGGEGLAGAPPGTRVDVLVTTESRSGSGGRTYVALQDVELLGVRPAPDGSSAAGGAGSRAGTVATLRVTLKEAVFLTAAQSFAREVRLLTRAAGDHRSGRPLSISSAAL